MITYSYTTPFNPYPQNQIEMKQSCDRIGEGLKCLKVHGKCLTNTFARRALSAFSGARSKHSRRLCANTNDQKSVDFWKAAECIKSKNKRELMVFSERELISTLQLLAVNTTIKWEERLHQACCAASDYANRVVRDIEPDCVKYKSVYGDMMDSMLRDVLESACPDQSRLNEMCPKLARLKLSKEWKPVSLVRAALEFVIALDDSPKQKQ